MLSAMAEVELTALEREVRTDPRHVGARLRLGQALIVTGQLEAGAAQLRLAAQLDPCNPHVAIMAAEALVRCGKERDAALLLSTRVAPTMATTMLAESELVLIEELLTHHKALVRCHAARAVGRLRIAQAVSALERACTDDNGAVRMAASAALRFLSAH